jgi:branched-chain amino acid transport system substrate-binding protein
VSTGVSIGYWSADVFLQMLQAAGKNLTPETFAAAMNKDFTYKPPFNPPGVGAVSFPRDKNEPTPCAAMIQVQGQRYALKAPMACYFS